MSVVSTQSYDLSDTHGHIIQAYMKREPAVVQYFCFDSADFYQLIVVNVRISAFTKTTGKSPKWNCKSPKCRHLPTRCGKCQL